MAREPVERKLAAILAVDVAGYSRMTGKDEEGTIRQLAQIRDQVIDPAVQRYHGRIIKTMGDGTLIEFASVVEALTGALAIARGSAARNAKLKPDDRMNLRIGLHLGDVVVQPDGDLLGDGVNVAARLEAIAEPGGICLSEDAYRQVRDRTNKKFIDLGEQQLKNIARPMRVYAIAPTGTQRAAKTKEPQPKKTPRTPSSEATPAMALPREVAVRGPGFRMRLRTIEDAARLIRDLPAEIASQPRWTFTAALLDEAAKTGKSRDLNTAVRQLMQALSNERWLEKPDESVSES